MGLCLRADPGPKVIEQANKDRPWRATTLEDILGGLVPKVPSDPHRSPGILQLKSWWLGGMVGLC